MVALTAVSWKRVCTWLNISENSLTADSQGRSLFKQWQPWQLGDVTWAVTIQDVDRRFDEFSAAGLAEVFEAHYVFLDKKSQSQKIMNKK